MSHALADDLAETLRVARERCIVWRELPVARGYADVYAIRPSWGAKDVRIYECKGSRADFLADTQALKFERYLPHCKRFFFATPQGLVRKAEVPEGCGLITKGENGWRVVVPARVREMEEPSFDFMASLLDRTFFEIVPNGRRLADEQRAHENYEHGWKAQKIGEDLAREIARPRGEVSADEEQRIELALDLYDAVTEGLRETGILKRSDPEWFDRGGTVRLAKFAVVVIKRAAAVQRMGEALSRLPYALQADLDALAEEA